MTSEELRLGAIKLIEAAKVESITVVLANAEDTPHAVTVNTCALREHFGGSELRVSVAVTTTDAVTTERVFVRASFNGRVGRYVEAVGCSLDIDTTYTDTQLARRLLKSDVPFRLAVAVSLSDLIAEQTSLMTAEIERNANGAQQ